MLPATSPESVGVSSAALLALVDGLEQGGFDPHAVAVARHGQAVMRGWWDPYRTDDAVLVHSLSKTFLSTAVGFAVAEGLLDLDAPVAEYFPEHTVRGRAAQIRVRDALTMTPGYEQDESAPIFGPDPVATLLAAEPEHDPGTVFTYNQPGPFLLSAALRRVSGQSLSSYLRPRLFEPLGIGQRWWSRAGELELGFTGYHARLDDLLSLGQLYLDDGRYGGTTVLPEGWAALASSSQVDNRARGWTSDWQEGYGFLFWRSTHGFRGDGACGQLCLVLPEEDLVVVVLAAAEDMQAEIDVVWRTVLPGLSGEPLPDAPRARSELAQRLADAEVPLAPSSSSGVLARATVQPEGDSWLVDLDGLTFQVGDARWHRTLVPVGDLVLPVAARGRAADDGGWEATAVLTSAPHRLLLRAGPGQATADVRWHIPPLRVDDPRSLAVPAWAAGTSPT